jgi:hypothetical protein
LAIELDGATAMPSRRSFFGALLCCGAVNALSLCSAQEPSTGNASLKETLVFGLRPRTPDDTAFIEMVVGRVEARTLPLTLVIETYRWAQNKRPYPYPFFERGLRIRARQAGIEL